MSPKFYLFFILPIIGFASSVSNRDIYLNIHYKGKKNVIQISESQTVNDLINLINTYYNINNIDKIIFNKKILIKDARLMDYKLENHDNLFIITKTLFEIN
jgi:hypothetical protein